MSSKIVGWLVGAWDGKNSELRTNLNKNWWTKLKVSNFQNYLKHSFFWKILNKFFYSGGIQYFWQKLHWTKNTLQVFKATFYAFQFQAEYLRYLTLTASHQIFICQSYPTSNSDSHNQGPGQEARSDINWTG